MVERVTTRRPAANDDLPGTGARAAANRRAEKSAPVAKVGFDKKTIALVYDFDGTLSPKPMQEYTVLPKLNVDPKAFWAASCVCRNPVVCRFHRSHHQSHRRRFHR